MILDENKNLISNAHTGVGDIFNQFLDDVKKGNINTCIQEALNTQNIIVIDNPCEKCFNYS